MNYEPGFFLRRARVVLILGLWLSAGCTRSFTQARPTIPGSPAAAQVTLAAPTSGEPTLQGTSTSSLTSEIPTATGEPSPTAPPPEPIAELPVRILLLAGPAASPEAEFSGMAWAGETLVLLPQHPEIFAENGTAALFSLTKRDLLAALNNASATPLEPERLPIDLAGLENSIPGYDGFEAIAFDGTRVYLTVESRQETTAAFLVSGFVAPDLSQVSLNPGLLTPIPAQADLTNFSDEALLVFGRRLMSFYEANGETVNSNPVAHLFDLDGSLVDAVSLQNVDYRITDVTPPDDFGRFWAINYFYPGDDFLMPLVDPIAEEYGEGESHRIYITVERLLEFQIGESGITLAETPPLYLELLDDDHSRNWEGIARLDSAGFLLVTDRYPETILGFVAFP